MRMLTFAKRCTREILRDPVNLAFGLGFPVALILLLSAIQANIPVGIYKIDHLATGMPVFGLSFMTLFSATLIAKDRESALLTNLSAWLSGVWFDLDLVGGVFAKAANLLPFVHAARMEKALYDGDFSLAAQHSVPVLVYCGATTVVAVLCFLRQMKKQ